MIEQSKITLNCQHLPDGSWLCAWGDDPLDYIVVNAFDESSPRLFDVLAVIERPWRRLLNRRNAYISPPLDSGRG